MTDQYSVGKATKKTKTKTDRPKDRQVDRSTDRQADRPADKGRVMLEREKEKGYNSGCICAYTRLCVCLSDYAYDSPVRWEKGGKRGNWRSGRVKGMCVVYATDEFVERL